MDSKIAKLALLLTKCGYPKKALQILEKQAGQPIYTPTDDEVFAAIESVQKSHGKVAQLHKLARYFYEQQGKITRPAKWLEWPGAIAKLIHARKISEVSERTYVVVKNKFKKGITFHKKSPDYIEVFYNGEIVGTLEQIEAETHSLTDAEDDAYWEWEPEDSIANSFPRQNIEGSIVEVKREVKTKIEKVIRKHLL